MPKTRTTIRGRLVRSFSLAILIPTLATAIVAVARIREQVYAQAEARVASDLTSALEHYRNRETRLRDAIRIHGTRRTLYEALDRGEVTLLGPELDRVRAEERLDVLTVFDRSGRLFHRSRAPAAREECRIAESIVQGALREAAPTSGTIIVGSGELAKESAELERQAFMELAPTPRAGPTERTEQRSGMMIVAASPVFDAEGRLRGALLGGVLLNRTTEIVDSIASTVFRDQTYQGHAVGTATIFQNDVRISTNVRNVDGSRAIATRASGEVASAVLVAGQIWRGRAFVVNDWYISAYAPIRDPAERIIGMLYVGTLERPYLDSLLGHLYVLLGISFAGVLLVTVVAVNLAQRISRPVRAMASAAKRIAEGDYRAQVDVASTDEVGYLASCFNRMSRELDRAHQELREWGEQLERKVERRAAEMKAIQTQMLQAEKLAAIGKLAAGVAHEINNPLTGVLTNASLLLAATAADDPKREDLQTVVDETMRCRKIVKGLLEFSRQAKPQVQRLDPNQVVGDVLGLVKNQASFRNIALETALAERLPPVLADRDQLRQVVLNIVLNAAEAMTSSGQLTLTSRFDASERLVWVEVRDNGPGIPEEIRARMFEPFFTTKRTGTGLGLAIAYGIVQEHGGRIVVESEPGQGTTMAIALPASASAADG